MTAWQLVRTHLAGDSTVTNIATGGIYPVRGKQGETRPQIIGRQTAGQDDESLTEVLHATATLEIGCVAYRDYDKAVELFDAVKAALRGMRKQTVGGKHVQAVRIGGVHDEDNPDSEWIGVVFTVDIRHQI